MSSKLLLLFVTISLGGCAAYQNQKLNELKTPPEHWRSNDTRSATFAEMESKAPDDSPAAIRGPSTTQPILRDDNCDGCFVGLAISGGGSRSANFAAACMLQLERIGLLQKVDYISSVSGGSMVGAYYCVGTDEQWTPGNVQKKLSHSFATDLITQVLLPWNSIALLCSTYDTTDILAEQFDRELFSRNGRSLTFADLRSDRPRLLINATDLQSGKRFVFCNESFDQINSDLSKYPLAHAVAASGAFPVVLHDKTVRDFSTMFKQYRHFIDGGVTDNLGIQSLIEAYTAQNTKRRDGREVPYPKGAVLIVLDAGARANAKLSHQADISVWDEIRQSADMASTALLARANSATLGDLLMLHTANTYTAEELRKQKEQLELTGRLTTMDRDGRPIRVIYIALSQLRRISDVPFGGFSESIENIATYYNIGSTEAYWLYQAADILINKQRATREELQRLVTELHK